MRTAKKIMQYPLLVIGLLMVYLFLHSLKERGIDWFKPERFRASSCRSANVMLEKRMPKQWHVHCDYKEEEMRVELPHDIAGAQTMTSSDRLKILANSLIFISKNSLNESLERVHSIGVFLPYSKGEQAYTLSAVVLGKHLAQIGRTDSDLVQKTLLHKYVTIQDRPAVINK